MNVLDLFSGIGGFSLGLERAGMRTVAFCEIDEYCRAVLRKHWPGIPCFTDIRALDASGLGGLGPINLVCGGFPCQPFSVAGKQAAYADDRHLWPEMRRVIALARPAWVVGENVAGIIPLALDDVLSDLEALGYAARAFVIPACAVDAPHRRDRVWIIARDTNSQGKSVGAVDAEVAELFGTMADPSSERRQQVAGSSHGDEGQNERRSQDGADEPGSGGQTDAYASAVLRRSQQWDESDGALQGDGTTANAESVGRREDVEPLAGEARERPRTGQPSGSSEAGSWYWLPEPDLGRVAHGVPRRVDRLRTLGNAVVPQVVEEIGRAIMRAAHG